MFAIWFGSVLGKIPTEPNQSVYSKYHPIGFCQPYTTKPITIGLVWFLIKKKKKKLVESKHGSIGIAPWTTCQTMHVNDTELHIKQKAMISLCLPSV